MSYLPVSTVAPANVPIAARASATFYWRATLQDATGTPIDLTGFHFRMRVADPTGAVLFDLADETNPAYGSLSGTLGAGTILVQGNGDVGGGTLGTGVVLAVLAQPAIARALGLAQLAYSFWVTSPLTIPTPTPTAIVDEWFVGTFAVGP